MLSSDDGERPVDREEIFPVVVTTADGASFRGQSIRVNVYDGVDGGVQVWLDGSDEDGEVGWSAIGSATLEDLDRGRLNFDLKKLPLTPGVGNATRWRDVDDLVAAEEGTLEIVLADGHQASGTAVAVPEAVGASFAGPFVVECWVAPAALGEPENGFGDGTVSVRIQDENFESEFCQRFIDWR